MRKFALFLVAALWMIAGVSPLGQALELDAEILAKLKADLKKELREEIKKELREEIKKELQEEQEKMFKEATAREAEAEHAKHEEPLFTYERGEGLAINDQRIVFRGFGDISFSAQDDRNGPKDDPNQFAVGDFDLFFNTRLTDRISGLGEIFFEFGEDGELVTDFERLVIQYSFRDWLNLSAGRHHTPMGYWNANFHHGKFFQTPIDRPLVVEFEDDGGLLPVHAIGMEIFGKQDFRLFNLGYSFDISNGRGPGIDLIQNSKDFNDSKALAFQVTLSPNPIPGLRVGTNLYLDRIPADRDNPERPDRARRIKETIFGGHLAYVENNWELISEVFRIQHKDRVFSKKFKTTGFYLLAAYQWDKFKPFYLFENISFDEGDPFYAPNDIDRSKHGFGLKYDLTLYNNLKIQYSYVDGDDKDSHLFQFATTFSF